MNKKLIAPLLLVSMMTLASCGADGAAKDHVKKHLKDPSSMKVSSCVKRENDTCISFEIVYNAKNSFGNYVGEEKIYVCQNKQDKTWECSHCESVPGYCSTMFYLGK